SLTQPIIPPPPLPHFLRQPQSHLERIRPIVVRSRRKVPQLIHQQPRPRRPAQKPQPPLRQARAQPPDAHLLVHMVMDRPPPHPPRNPAGNTFGVFLPPPPNPQRQNSWPPAPPRAPHPRRPPPTQVGLDIDPARRIDPQHHQRRVIAAPCIAPFARIERDR